MMELAMAVLAVCLILRSPVIRRYRRWPDPHRGAPLGQVPPKPALWQQLDRDASSWKVVKRGRRA
jgi:hypothetical protein